MSDENLKQGTRKTVKDSILDGASHGAGELNQAIDIQAKAAQHGFDWPNIEPVFDKIAEELEELKQEVRKGKERHGFSFSSNNLEGPVNPEIQAEFGDLLFSCLNLSRFLGVRPEDALQTTNAKFMSRFRFIEERLQEKGEQMEQVSLSRLDQLWELAKKHERT